MVGHDMIGQGIIGQGIIGHGMGRWLQGPLVASQHEWQQIMFPEVN